MAKWWGWRDAPVTVFPGRDWNRPPFECRLPVFHVAASHGVQTKQIPYGMATWCADPCTQILHDSCRNWKDSNSKVRHEKLKQIRETRAERRSTERLRA